MTLILPQMFFKHFASKNQLPGFYISRTLVENRLRIFISFAFKNSRVFLFLFVCFEFAETVVWRCSVKKVFLEILQNSQESTCATCRPPAYNFIKKRLWQRCLLVNFAKFLRTPFLTEYLR